MQVVELDLLVVVGRGRKATRREQGDFIGPRVGGISGCAKRYPRQHRVTTAVGGPEEAAGEELPFSARVASVVYEAWNLLDFKW